MNAQHHDRHDHDAASHDAHGHDPEAIGELPKAPQLGKGTLLGLGGALAVLLVVGFLAGLLPRIRKGDALEADTMRLVTRRPVVQVTSPKVRPPSNELLLPGTVQPLQEAAIYARTSGYLRQLASDLGDSVKAGQLLAEIETPEIDDQLRGAQALLGEVHAALEQAKTQRELAKVNLARANALSPSGYTSAQERDEKEAAFHMAEANVQMAQAKIATQEAEVSRLRQLKAFARVTAPFNGVVTQRNTEVGALVTSGGGQPLFRIAKSDVVRVFVNVPQNVAGGVREGAKTAVSVRELPGRTFTGTVTRTSKALDDLSHTLLAEVHIPNDQRELLPGMFVQVRFAVTRSEPEIAVPANALLFGAQGPQLVVVDGSEHLHVKSVRLGEDYGTEVAVVDGLTKDEQVVLNPGDKAIEGLAVAVQKAKAPAGPKPVEGQKPIHD